MKFYSLLIRCFFVPSISYGESFPTPVFVDANVGYPFSEGIAKVMRYRTSQELRLDGEGMEDAINRYGFINRAGKIAIPLTYYDAGDFSEGLAPVAKLVNGAIKYGFIDHHGIEVLRFRYEFATSFSEGLAAVRIAGKWGYINHSGDTIIRPSFSRVQPFKEGVAFVEIEGNRSIFINKTGQKSIEIPNEIASGFSEGVTAVSDGWIGHDGKKFPKKSEKTISISPFNGFSEGKITVTLPYNGHSTDYNFVDHNGTLLSQVRFGNVGSFSEGLAAVIRDADDKCGFINSAGELMIPHNFGSFQDIPNPPPIKFSEGLVFVEGGYIGHNGNYVIRMRPSVKL